jgi:hypothetical protein
MLNENDKNTNLIGTIDIIPDKLKKLAKTKLALYN